MGNGLDNLSIDNIAGGYSKYSSTYIDNDKETSSYLDFDDYLKVLAAQMSNQDFNDPMSDSEMLQQMSSYSMLEGIKTMTMQSNISYASGLVGKAVTVNDGESYDTGMVESVVIQDGKPYLSINGGLYESDKITDICDVEIFNKLSSLIGLTVNADLGNGDGSYVTGDVTNVLFVGGEALVVLSGKSAFPLSSISIPPKDNTGSTAESGSGTVTEEKDGDDSSDDGSTGGVVTEETVATETSALAYDSYATRSEKLYRELMSTIDAISGQTTAEAASGASDDSITDSRLIYDTVSELSVPDYAAGIMALTGNMNDYLTASDFAPVNASEVNPLLGSTGSWTENSTSSSSSPSYSSTGAAVTGWYDDTSSSVYSSQTTVMQHGSITYGPAKDGYITLTTGNFSAVLAGDKDGRLSGSISNDELYNLIASGKYTARYNDLHGVELVSDVAPGMSTADCVPHRLDAKNHPEEAALADSLGTRMYDIKFIHNNAVNSRIDTSTVIARTMSGKEVTEIGFSGIGQLGEVVTFKDGTQRVEIMLKNSGKSVWVTTSGKYTLDQICDTAARYGSLQGKFTPAEEYIRFYGTKEAFKKMAGMTT